MRDRITQCTDYFLFCFGRLRLTFLPLILLGYIKPPYRSPASKKKDRLAVAPSALRQVLLKVVGDRAAMEEVNITSLLNQASDMIYQYQYQRKDKKIANLTEPDSLEIVLSFNKEMLKQAITALGLPYWGESRPDVLIWLAVDDGDKTIVSADSALPLVDVIHETAFMRGLPIVLPLMDLEDQSQVNFLDIWAGFSEHIINASTRYGAPVIVMATVATSLDGTAQIRWQTWTNNTMQSWHSSGDVNLAIQLGIEELADRLARRFSYTLADGSTTHVNVQISDISSYSDYSRVFDYLTNLQYVSRVHLVSLAADKLDVTLYLAGDLALFDRALTIDRVLVKRPSIATSKIIHYRLLP